MTDAQVIHSYLFVGHWTNSETRYSIWKM